MTMAQYYCTIKIWSDGLHTEAKIRKYTEQ